MMNIYDALNKIDFKFREYFKYLHPELRPHQSKPLKTEDDFLRLVDRKSMMPFHRWEKSAQYKALISLYLDYRIADDFEDIYNVVVANAKKGDEQSVRLFLQLQKDVKANAKTAVKEVEQPYIVKSDYKKDESDDDNDNEGLALE